MWKENSEDSLKLKQKNNILQKENKMQAVQIVTLENKVKELEFLVSNFQEQLKFAPTTNPYVIKKINTNSSL